MDLIQSLCAFICLCSLLMPFEFLKSLFSKSICVLGLASTYRTSGDYNYRVSDLLQVFYQIYVYELRNLYIDRMETSSTCGIMGEKKMDLLYRIELY